MAWTTPVLADPDSLEQLRGKLDGAREQVEDLSTLVESLQREMKAQEMDFNEMRARTLQLQARQRQQATAPDAKLEELKARLATSEERVRLLEQKLAATPSAATLQESKAAIPTSQAQAIPPVYFGLSDGALVREYQRVLGVLKSALVTNSKSMFRLTGHSNAEGDENVNLRQSALRAESLAGYLTTHGIPRQCLEVVAAGARHPLHKPNSKEGRKMNRRVEVEILR